MRLVGEMNISVREAEQRLDTKLILEEIPRWYPRGPHHALLYQRMFEHTSKSVQFEEYHGGIHWDHQQPSQEGGPQAEVSAMGLLTPEMTLDEIFALYQEVYQCRRELREVQYTKDMVGKAHNKMLEAIRACLWHRWGSSQLAEPRQISRTSGEAQYHPYMQLPHDHLDFHWARQWPYREEAREAHWQVLATAAMFEGHIESLHWSTSHGQQQSYKQSSSCQHSRSQRHSRSRGQHMSNKRQAILPEGRDQRWAVSSSLVWPRWQVTFKDTSIAHTPGMTPKLVDNMCPTEEDQLPSPSNDSSGTAETVDLTQPMEGDDSSLSGNSDNMVDWSQAMGEDLGNLPILHSDLSKFLSGAGPPDGDDGPEWLETPKPPLDDPKKSVAWQAHWVETLDLWPELVMVPTPRDPISFAKHMRASFQFPKVKYLWGWSDDYTPPPAPHCIEWDAFLPQAKGDFGSLDFRFWQPKKTLALVKALQFWADRSQPSGAHGKWQLAECVKELREQMKPMTTFTNEDILNNDPASPWKKVTPSRGTMVGEEKLQEAVGVQSRSKMQRPRPQGFFTGHPSSRAFQATHHPVNNGGSNHLCPCYPQSANYFCLGVGAPRQTDGKEMSPTTWVLGDQFYGRVMPPESWSPSLREDTHTKPLGRDCHCNDDIHAIVARHQSRFHLYQLSDCLYEPS